VGLVHLDRGELLPVVEATLQMPEVPAVADPAEQQLGLSVGSLHPLLRCRPQAGGGVRTGQNVAAPPAHGRRAAELVEHPLLNVLGGEDPHYGLFGGAYLVAAYANRIGLKGYDFTISDEPARDNLNERQLVRVFGPDVFDKVKANGFDIDRNNLPSTEEVVQDLLKRAHAFYLEVDGYDRYNAHAFWTRVFGPERVIVLPRIELLPQVQAIIIGLTEGTLSLSDVTGFLTEAKVTKEEAKRIENSVANIPIGAQEVLREGIRVPQKGDLYRDKTDLWPIDPSEVPDAITEESDEPVWL
jgi:hypothetical protein